MMVINMNNQLNKKIVLQFNDNGQLVFIGGICKAKDLQ